MCICLVLCIEVSDEWKDCLGYEVKNTTELTRQLLATIDKIASKKLK